MERLGAICLRNLGNFRPIGRWTSTSQLPNIGSGVGKGGGAGGSVRELGGAFGLREAAEEEIFFRKLTAQQFDELRSLHVEEIRYLEKELRDSAAAIQRHKQKLRTLKKLTEGTEPENPMNVRVD